MEDPAPYGPPTPPTDPIRELIEAAKETLDHMFVALQYSPSGHRLLSAIKSAEKHLSVQREETEEEIRARARKDARESMIFNEEYRKTIGY